MGSGIYSYSAYCDESATRGYASKSVNTVFTNSSIADTVTTHSFRADARSYNMDVKREMLNVGVRECRDSDEHPNSTPIIIALDVTGSMRETPHYMITKQFPLLMNALMQLGVPDPQLLFMAVGDHECDRYPIQVAQFESDTKKLLDSVEQFVLEGGGGGNDGESYLLSWLIAGYHTETDSWFKRNKKGFLFTIGDEPTLTTVDADYLVKGLGYQSGIKNMSLDEILPKAREQYNVYHVHINDGSHYFSNTWEKLLPNHVLRCVSEDLSKTITTAIADSLKEGND